MLLERRFRAPLLTVSLGVGLFSFNEFLVSTTLPSAGRATGGAALMSWAVTFYLAPSIVGGSSAAALGQRWGLRPMLFLSGLVFLAGTLLACAAPSMAVILLGRALQGAADGVIASLCYTLIPALFPPALIGRVFGVEALIWAGSALGGPLLAGWVTQLLSWRAAFLLNLPLIAGFLLLVPLVVPREPPRGVRTGAPLLRLAGIAGGILAVAAADVITRPGPQLGCLALALALLVCSVRADRGSGTRLFPPSMFRLSDRSGAAYWSILLMPLAQAASGVYLVLALQRIWSLRPAAAGGIGALMALSWSIAAFVVAGLPSARARQARFGPALNAAGLLGLLLALRSGCFALVVGGQLATGAGFGLCWSTLSERVMQEAAPDERDRAAALLPTVLSAGYAIGAAVAGLVANQAGLPRAMADGGSVAPPLCWAYGTASLIAAVAVMVERGAAFAQRC